MRPPSGPSAANAVIALAAVYTPRTARIARASVLVPPRDGLRARPSRASGAAHGRCAPSPATSSPTASAPLIVQLTFVFAYAVLAEADPLLPRHGAAPAHPDLGQRHRRAAELPPGGALDLRSSPGSAIARDGARPQPPRGRAPRRARPADEGVAGVDPTRRPCGATGRVEPAPCRIRPRALTLSSLAWCEPDRHDEDVGYPDPGLDRGRRARRGAPRPSSGDLRSDRRLPAPPRCYSRSSSHTSSHACVVSARDSTSTRSSLPWNRGAMVSAVSAREKRPNP